MLNPHPSCRDPSCDQVPLTWARSKISIARCPSVGLRQKVTCKSGIIVAIVDELFAGCFSIVPGFFALFLLSGATELVDRLFHVFALFAFFLHCTHLQRDHLPPSEACTRGQLKKARVQAEPKSSHLYSVPCIRIPPVAPLLLGKFALECVFYPLLYLAVCFVVPAPNTTPFSCCFFSIRHVQVASSTQFHLRLAPGLPCVYPGSTRRDFSKWVASTHWPASAAPADTGVSTALVERDSAWVLLELLGSSLRPLPFFFWSSPRMTGCLSWCLKIWLYTLPERFVSLPWNVLCSSPYDIPAGDV